QSPAVEVSLPRSRADIRQDRPAATRRVAFIHAHAAMDDGRAVLALVNLDLERAHAVEIRLPFGMARAITRHGLSGDPRDTNLDAENVRLEQSALDATLLQDGRMPMTIAPGDGFVLEIKR